MTPPQLYAYSLFCTNQRLAEWHVLVPSWAQGDAAVRRKPCVLRFAFCVLRGEGEIAVGIAGGCGAHGIGPVCVTR